MCDVIYAMSTWQKELSICIFIAPLNVAAMKYIESRTTQYMGKEITLWGRGIILHPQMSHAEPTTLYAFIFCL